MTIDKSHKYCEFCKNNRPFKFPDDLFEALIKDELVIFAGAGISTENKSVFPYTFYEDILGKMKYPRDSNISFSKLMSDFCNKTGGKYKMIKYIKERIDYVSSFPELYGIAIRFHEQLARLPCIKEIVTTNWDDYFEVVCHATPFTYEKDMVYWESTARKVLKLHGSINNLSSIIATEEDYKTRYKSLNKGLIGGQLKLLIANRRIVFIGYSFGDEDFNRIYSFLRNQLGDFMKKPYIITLDEKNDKKWRELGLEPIYTAGDYFLHAISKKCEERGCIISDDVVIAVYKELDAIIDSHHKLAAKMDLFKYPEEIYCFSYQDGIIHAFDHFLHHINYGESLCKNNIKRILLGYENTLNEKKKRKKWWDVAYIQGYINGHVFVSVTNKGRKIFPRYLDLSLGKELRTEKEYIHSLQITKGRRSSISKYASDFVKKKIPDNSIVPQHTAFLL